MLLHIDNILSLKDIGNGILVCLFLSRDILPYVLISVLQYYIIETAFTVLAAPPDIASGLDAKKDEWLPLA